jgi:tRNA 2-thiocytidine biosynthesis protein TtcA
VSLSQLADRGRFDFENLPLDRTGEREAYAYDEAEISSSNLGHEALLKVVNLP